MNLLEVILGWQMRAKNIKPPEDTGVLPARGGLPGPAFFPEGFGLQHPTPDAPWPNIMAVGHNFGCEDYRDEINASGREDDKAAWRNFRGLLTDADVPIESCFMTNWFVGLQPGSKQVGEFLSRPDSRYERECSELLLGADTNLESARHPVTRTRGRRSRTSESCHLLDLGQTPETGA